jgi:hypothetical protein
VSCRGCKCGGGGCLKNKAVIKIIEERDRYKKALEIIAASKDDDQLWIALYCVKVAEEALKEQGEDG